MRFAHRIKHGPAMEKRLESEIGALCEKYPQGIVIRLHVLGDFYSRRYVLFWQRMLLDHPNLKLYGYTARPEDSVIGKEILLLNLRFAERCAIRWSRSKENGGLGRWYAAEEGFEGESFTCPEQTGKVASCADCGLCWKASKTVRFLSH